ncbi:MAG: hypothetical protein AABO58_17055 [Acidobacteriota bacterium]
MSDKKVTVTITSRTISVHPDPVQPKKEQDKVKWECDTSAFAIDLAGQRIQSRPEGSKHVGMSNTFSKVEKLKYTVSAPGADPLDPEVDVQP